MVERLNYNKKVECKVKFSLADLDKFEDFMQCIPLCPKHNAELVKSLKQQNEFEFMWQNCPECAKVRKSWKAPVDKLYLQLCRKFYP